MLQVFTVVKISASSHFATKQNKVICGNATACKRWESQTFAISTNCGFSCFRLLFAGGTDKGQTWTIHSRFPSLHCNRQAYTSFKRGKQNVSALIGCCCKLLCCFGSINQRPTGTEQGMIEGGLSLIVTTSLVCVADGNSPLTGGS